MFRSTALPRTVAGRLGAGTIKRSASTARSSYSKPMRYGGAIAISLASLAYLKSPTYLDSLTTAKDIDDNPSPPPSRAEGKGLIPYSEVQKHNTPEDCWVVIDGKVYDLTEFAKENHPGGSHPIHRVAGRDATGIFQPTHPPGTIENGLDPEAYLGLVDPMTLPEIAPPSGSSSKQERKIELSEIIGIPDFDEAARRILTGKAWAYMSAGATDMYTLDLNRKAFNWILFRPRVMVDVDVVDTSTHMLGQKTSLPIFLCPTGMAGLAHPQGERLLSAGAGDCDAIYMVSTNASAPLDEIIGAKTKTNQPLFMQLYVDRNRSKTEALLKKINSLGLKAIFVTVDAAAPGKREADERSRAEVELQSGVSGGKIATDTKGGGIGRSVGGFIDPKLSWDDIAWLRKHTHLPIGLKGVQTVEDVVKAAELGVDAIYLSNHGGRALDTAPPALYTLLEVHKMCPEVMRKCEFYIDGGVRRGTDVVKALCLGAKGVGLGRPFLYSLTYGKEGVVHGIEILRDEIETTMRLLGVTRIDQLGPHLLNTRILDSQINEGPHWGPQEKRAGEDLFTSRSK